MRTITLELLRHGPAHNQLLSPLTSYLALCQNHGAVTVHLPFEHNQFLHRLSALGYKLKEESRIFQLNDTARVMGEILAEIPGLTAESSKGSEGDDPLVHLRLIISASELALLPFELALSPDGFPGAGQHLLLQPQMPVCLTREIRRAPSDRREWPRQPRILFAAAAPPREDGQIPAIPLKSHLLALRRAIRPWVGYYDDNAPDMRRERVEEHLVFLPGASVEAIEEACATGSFTHVHILAHGVEVQENYDTRFCLALHRARDPRQTDYVSGSRLATALRASQRPGSGSLARPAVVTLSSCDSGNVGSVAGAGSSIAHALHDAGIPMVIAAQFPLSFEGSVRFVEVLYNESLWGTDPRRTLHDLRRRLYADFPQRHDWASLTAYVSLPQDFERQLSETQIDQAMRSIDAALNHADKATRSLFHESPRDNSKEEERPARSLHEKAKGKIEIATRRLESLLETIPSESSRIYGLLASTEKRHAEVLYSMHWRTQGTAGLEQQYDLLRRARDHYWDAYALDRAKAWALVQHLSLQQIIKQMMLPAGSEIEKPDKNPGALWSLARSLSMLDLRSAVKKHVIWAHGNLIELHLLAPLMASSADRPDVLEPDQLILEHADALIETAGRHSFDVYATRRQISRYVRWFAKVADIGPLVVLAEQVLARFPEEEVEEHWK